MAFSDRLLRIARACCIAVPPACLFGPAVADVFLCLMTLCFLAYSTRTRSWGWLRERWVQCALALALYATIRNAVNDDGMNAALIALGWVRLPLAAAALAYWVLPDERTERWLLRGLGFTTVFLILDGLWQFQTGTDIFARAIIMSEGYPRLTGPYTSPHVGITLVWLAFPVLAWLMGGSAGLRGRVGGVALAAGAVLLVVVSGERMALGLLGLGLVLSFLLLPQARMLLAVAACLAMLGAFTIGQSHQLVLDRQVGATSQTAGKFWDSVYGRTWISATKIAAQHPLFGIGEKQFQAECSKPEYGPTDPESLKYRCPRHPHNLYLAWLTDGGIIGAGLMLCVFTCWAGLALKHWRMWWRAPLATGLLIAVMLRLWPISVTPNHMTSWVLLPLWFFVGWLLALLRSTGSSKSAA